MGASGSGGSSDGDPAIELTPAARQIAAAMCAAQNLQGPPPAQVGVAGRTLSLAGSGQTSRQAPGSGVAVSAALPCLCSAATR